MAGSRWEDVYSRVKLGSGLVLYSYLILHLSNHALGLISLQAMEDGAVLFKAVWRSWPGTILLYGAIVLHPLLALSNWVRRGDRKSTRLNSSHSCASRMPSFA